MKISLFTEITDTRDMQDDPAGHLFYDGSCPLCCRWIARISPILDKRKVLTVPFADGGSEPEMTLRWHDGREFGGAEAAIFLAGRIWWAWPAFLLARLPGVRPLLAAGYRRIAARRHCGSGGACQLAGPPPRVTLTRGWSITGLLVAAAIAAGLLLHDLPAWIWMWILAGAQWVSFKFIASTRCHPRPAPWFLAWVGMDAAAFAPDRDQIGRKDSGYRGGFVGLLLGLFLLAEVAPRVSHPVAVGWIGMTGLVCALHFGLFEWMATIWNRLGRPVKPIMRAPWKAISLADFWGARWNRAFSDVARIAVFRPLVRRFGVAWGTLGGFLLSGIAHEMVISVPARSGFGLPTLYFLIQGLAVLAERRWFPRPGAAGRLFLWTVLLLPAPLLFHPPFLEAVIAPMIQFAHSF